MKTSRHKEGHHKGTTKSQQTRQNTQTQGKKEHQVQMWPPDIPPTFIPGGQGSGERQIYQGQGDPISNYTMNEGTRLAPMTEQGEPSVNHQYYQSANQEQQVFIPASHTIQHPTQMQYIHPQTHTTVPFRQPQEQVTYQ